MAATPSQTGTVKDPTFRNYNASQAKTYVRQRLSYPPQLFTQLLDHHKATGGQFHSLVDVGCGPGVATRDLAHYFDQATGVDPSPEMLNVARELGGRSKEGEIRYELAPAENCADVAGLEPESVDLITAATAAHWFDMEGFWKSADTLLKPNGTVGIWTTASDYCHPSTPNAEEVQKIMHHFEHEVLAPYELASNRISRSLYDNLQLPWQVSPPVASFPQSSYTRLEWNRDGKASPDGTFFNGREVTLAQAEAALGTASMVTRWREAHPDLVGTDRDCVKEFIARLRKALGGQEKVLSGQAVVLLLFKKGAQ